MNRSRNWYDNGPDQCEQSTFPFQKSDRYDNGMISFPCERSLSYKELSIFIAKFGTTELFILILDLSAIIRQSPCCYVVITSKIGL